MKKGFTPIRSGFTLLELLIVVGIISLLVTLGTSIYASAQRSSRDAKRKADLEEIRAALELYRSNDSSGSYPNTATINNAMTDGCNNNGGISTYLSKIPEDPRCQIYKYYYTAFDSGGGACTGTKVCTDYTTGAYLEQGVTFINGTNCKVITEGEQRCNYALGPYGQK